MAESTPIHDELTAEWFATELELTDNLAALVAEGVPYLDACRVIFDGPTATTSPAARQAWVASVVRQQIADMVKRLPWLRGAV